MIQKLQPVNLPIKILHRINTIGNILKAKAMNKRTYRGLKIEISKLEVKFPEHNLLQEIRASWLLLGIENFHLRFSLPVNNGEIRLEKNYPGFPPWLLLNEEIILRNFNHKKLGSHYHNLYNKLYFLLYVIKDQATEHAGRETLHYLYWHKLVEKLEKNKTR